MIAKREEEGKVVVPWDFSKRSLVALHSAFELVGDSSQIRVIHVAGPLAGPDNGALYQTTESQKAKEIRKQFYEQVGEDERFKNVDFFVNFGNVAQEIVRFAESYRAGLIIMSSRGRKGLARFMFGGMDERVVRLATCPVLTVPNERLGQSNRKIRWQAFGIGPKTPESALVPIGASRKSNPG